MGAKTEIYSMMCNLASKGIAIIMISSELPEILGMSDRIIVMHEVERKRISFLMKITAIRFVQNSF